VGNSRLLTKLSVATFLFSMANTSGVTVTVLNPPVPSLAGAGSSGGGLSSSLTALEVTGQNFSNGDCVSCQYTTVH